MTADDYWGLLGIVSGAPNPTARRGETLSELGMSA
jgi:hypothetical protein